MSPISSAIKLAQFGVIGLGVMGENLALNIEEHGQSVAVWNLEAEWVERFVTANAGKQIVGSLRSISLSARSSARAAC